MNSLRKLWKFCGDDPEESDEEESKPSPVIEDESESNRVSSGGDFKFLELDTESPGGYNECQPGICYKIIQNFEQD